MESFNLERSIRIESTYYSSSGGNVNTGISTIAPFTYQGIPYLWGSGDITTLTSNQVTRQSDAFGYDDYFGIAGAIAVGCGRIVVGAWDTRVNGSSVGAVYVFDFEDSQKMLLITASDGAVNDRFGSSVAIGNGKIVVGAYYDDDTDPNSGSVYVYNLDGTGEFKINASDVDSGDLFGYSVSVGYGKIAVGCPGKNLINPGIGLDPPNAGGVYLYDLDGTNEIIIDHPDPDQDASYDEFGSSIAIGCGRLIIGCRYENGGYNNSQYSVGAVYIYDLQGNYIARLSPSSFENFSFGSGSTGNGNHFGYSVDVADGLIAIGSPGWDSDDDQGAVYIYDIMGNDLFRITSSDGASGDRFGESVAIGQGRIVVCAPSEDDGAVYVYNYHGELLEKLTPPNLDQFRSVAIGDGKLIIGDPGYIYGGSQIFVRDTPLVYSLYDLTDMEFGT